MASHADDAAERSFSFPVPPARTRAPDAKTTTTREALLAAAVDAFGKSGFDGVSIREIERRAGVNRGLVAHYFGTKEVLWEAAVEWLMSEFGARHARHEEFLGLVSVGERARIIFRIYALFVAEHPEFFRLLFIEGREASPRTRILADKYLRPLTAFFEDITDLEDTDAEARAARHLAVLGALSLAFAVPGYTQVMFGVDPAEGTFPERMADLVGDLWLGTNPRT